MYLLFESFQLENVIFYETVPPVNIKVTPYINK